MKLQGQQKKLLLFFFGSLVLYFRGKKCRRDFEKNIYKRRVLKFGMIKVNKGAHCFSIV